VTGRANHRGWIVLESIESDDRSLCVDFFMDRNGEFGFELFRADPEDGGRWQSLSLHGASRFTNLVDAARCAEADVVWLTSQPRASASFQKWLRENGLA
jgi:hypothetical protein